MIVGRVSIAAVAAVLLAGCARPLPVDPCSADPAFAPWDANEPAPAPAATRPPDPTSGTADALIATYQRRLRRPELPGAGCQFHPTCSEFARQALRRYGIVGLLFAFDRLLIREQPLAGPSYPPACVGGEPRWHDPVP